MTKLGLTAGKFNKRVVISSTDSGNDLSSGTAVAIKFMRYAQVFKKREAVPVEGGSVSDKQDYIFNIRKDLETEKIDQNYVLRYKNQDYKVLNVDNFNVGLISVLSTKRQ